MIAEPIVIEIGEKKAVVFEAENGRGRMLTIKEPSPRHDNRVVFPMDTPAQAAALAELGRSIVALATARGYALRTLSDSAASTKAA